MGGVKPYAQVDLKEWLLPGITDPADFPHIFVIGLQSIMPNKGSRWNKNADRLAFMQNNIMTVLNTHASRAEYTLVRQTDQHGLVILLIAKSEVQTRMFDVSMAAVKAPIANPSGNKGAVAVRFGFEDSTFIFLNCHLCGGKDMRNVEERHAQLGQLTNMVYKGDRGTQYHGYQLENHNVKVLFGDLNFRVNMPKPDMIGQIKQKNYQPMMARDELYMHGMQSKVLKDYQEGQLLFDPTYKYDMGTANYDVNPRKVPAWTDRVLFSQ